ncbi:putative uncharacterized protein [Pseudomonas sp. StFLB209]|uniref:hypothetical protein n=1 Tax=Pseudomonas sp. StFLB209 TaxID=1028989 RepID=UPI0004F8F50E|nr:hypothetical protein [Pseudomonas sp. StFLB209]BAP41595.1 putative uncharacterized protein [Pseudomonas sp. StFLB209]
MKWLRLLCVVALGAGLSGCLNGAAIELPWQPLEPYRAGYRDGCADKLKQDYDRNRKVPATDEAEYLRGLSDGFALCDAERARRIPSGSYAPPPAFPDDDKDAALKTKDCREKRRLCYPEVRNN